MYKSTNDSQTVDVRWGLIGAGDVCERKSGPPLYNIPGHSLRAVTRRDKEKGLDFTRRHAGEYFPDLQSVLTQREINAVYIATPPELHAEQCIAAAEAGKHVLVEKPMAVTTDECRKMVHACQAHNVNLAVAYYRRMFPVILDAKSRIDSQEIGKIQEIWMNNQFPPSHRLDLVHFLAGEFHSVRTETDGDKLQLFGGTNSGISIQMNLGWKEIAGEAEQILIKGSHGEIHISDLKAGKSRIVSSGGSHNLEFDTFDWTHWGLIENFGYALAGLEPLICDGREGLKSTSVLETISALPTNRNLTRVDYNNPPHINPETAAKHHLLG